MDNPAFWHLALTHIPVMGSLFGFLLLAWARLCQSRELALASLSLMFIAAVICVPVYLTGEPAEGVIKLLPGVSRPVMHRHEEAAEVAFIGIIALGIVAASGLAAARVSSRIFKGCQYMALVGSALVAGWMVWTAHLGGLIRHPEINGGAMVLAAKSTGGH